MKKIMAEIDALLRTSYPKSWSAMDPAPDPGAVKDLECRLGRPLGEPLRELYRWKGGCLGFWKTREDEEYARGWDWLQVDGIEAEHAAAAQAGGSREWFDAAWIPVFSNCAGDSLCVDAKGRIVRFLHDMDERKVVYSSLQALLEDVLQCMRKGTWARGPEFTDPGKAREQADAALARELQRMDSGDIGDSVDCALRLVDRGFREHALRIVEKARRLLIAESYGPRVPQIKEGLDLVEREARKKG